MRIDYEALKKICLTKINNFYSLGIVQETKDGILISRTQENNKILAVAHLDTVLSTNHFHVNKIDGKDFVFNAQLDDRLGAYILIALLPSLGLKYDLLLTEGEESGRSTAQYFESKKQYNWMFSFDRRGDDVVMYEYDNLKSRELLKQFGFVPSFGSFSDICFLDHLGCMGFNFGTGYHGEHSHLCRADISQTVAQVTKFVPFFESLKNTPMPYAPEPHNYTVNPYGGRFLDYEGWEDYDLESCEFCGNSLEGRDKDYGCCEDCAIDNGILCEICTSRLSMDFIQYSTICRSCEDRYSDFVA